MISVGSVGVAEVGNEDEDKGEDPVGGVDAADDDEDEDEEEGGCEGELDAKEHEHGWMEESISLQESALRRCLARVVEYD